MDDEFTAATLTFKQQTCIYILKFYNMTHILEGKEQPKIEQGTYASRNTTKLFRYKGRNAKRRRSIQACKGLYTLICLVRKYHDINKQSLDSLTSGIK